MGNVDWLLLLVDARLHAVVADAVPGRGDYRVIDADNGERPDYLTARLHHLELGDALLERAAGERHVEEALLERGAPTVRRGLVDEALRARVLALLVAPNAVACLVERAHEIGAGVGQCEPFAAAQVVRGHVIGGKPGVFVDLDRHQAQRVQLARHLEEDATAVPLAPRVGLHRPGGVVQRELDLLGMRGLVLAATPSRASRTPAR